MNDANDTERWDEEGHHPMKANAKNSLPRRKADAVLRVIRNALAHGNIVYLNEHGLDEHNTKLQFSGFYPATRKRMRIKQNQRHIG
jgi:hypothetical protein